MSWTIKAANELEMGVKVEMEHADTIKWLIEKVNKGTPVAEDLLKETATKIAQDHLKEMPDYYTKLKAMEGNKKPPAKVDETQSKPDNNPDKQKPEES